MARCIYKTDNGYQVEERTHHHPNCVGHLPSYIPIKDWRFVIKDNNGVFRVCEKKKSKYLKDLISGKISEPI